MYRSVMLQTLRYKDISLTTRMCIRSRNFSSSTCDDRYCLIIKFSISPSTVVRIVEGFPLARNNRYPVDAGYARTAQSVVQPSIFEILLIIDRLPCFVIIMNGIPPARIIMVYACPIHHDVFCRIRFSRSHYNKSRIARAVDRSRGS